jgi:hypothetical protein
VVGGVGSQICIPSEDGSCAASQFYASCSYMLASRVVTLPRRRRCRWCHERAQRAVAARRLDKTRRNARLLYPLAVLPTHWSADRTAALVDDRACRAHVPAHAGRHRVSQQTVRTFRQINNPRLSRSIRLVRAATAVYCPLRLATGQSQRRGASRRSQRTRASGRAPPQQPQPQQPPQRATPRWRRL